MNDDILEEIGMLVDLPDTPASAVRALERAYDEIERLREKLRGSRDGADSLRNALQRMGEAHDNLWDQNVELTRERDGLRETLGRYGQHEESCGRTLLRSSTIPPAPCSCGYQAALGYQTAMDGPVADEENTMDNTTTASDTWREAYRTSERLRANLASRCDELEAEVERLSYENTYLLTERDALIDALCVAYDELGQGDKRAAVDAARITIADALRDDDLAARAVLDGATDDG